MSPVINDGSVVWIDRVDQNPREGEIFAFLLPDKTVTIKRLIKVMPEYVIIDGDNRDPEARKSEELRDYPQAVELNEDVSVIRGRVIWILNRLIEKPAK
jgi:phage repressor protein C with HTH and peptisase S24 domain